MTRAEAIYRLKNTAWLGSDADRVATEEAVQMAIEALKEQKTGKWTTKSDTNPYYTTWWYECSECGQYPPKDVYGQEVLSDYCPSCGCRMVGEEE